MMVKIMMTSILCFVQISCTLVPDSFLSWIPTDQKMHQTSPFHITFIIVLLAIMIISTNTSTVIIINATHAMTITIIILMREGIL